MKFHQLILASIYEPKKLAAFRLLPIGRVFQYVFIFVTLLTLISFTRFLLGNSAIFDVSPEIMEHGHTIGVVIYPIAFLLQLIISTIYIFVRISIFGYIGVVLLKLLKRRGEFRQMWRTSAIASTVPIFLTITLDFFPISDQTVLMITTFIHFTYIALAAKYYPKMPS